MDIKAYIESGIIESYVMRLTSPEETADVVSMMSAYPEIAKAVNDFEISLEQHLTANAVVPSPDVKQYALPQSLQNNNLIKVNNHRIYILKDQQLEIYSLQ